MIGWAGCAAEDADSLAALAAQADQARETLAELEADWERESAALALLAATLSDQHHQRREERLAAQTEVENRQAELAAVTAASAQQEHLAALRQRLAQRIAQELRRMQAGILGLHRAQSTGYIGSDLGEAFAALATAEQESRRIVIRDLVGTDNGGERRAVQVLVMGGSQAWWLAPNGDAGLAVIGTELTLLPAASPADAAMIRSAIAIAEGAQAPAVIELPMAEPAP